MPGDDFLGGPHAATADAEPPPAEQSLSGARGTWGLTPYEKLASKDSGMVVEEVTGSGHVDSLAMPGQVEDDTPRQARGSAPGPPGAGPLPTSNEPGISDGLALHGAGAWDNMEYLPDTSGQLDASRQSWHSTTCPALPVSVLGEDGERRDDTAYSPDDGAAGMELGRPRSGWEIKGSGENQLPAVREPRNQLFSKLAGRSSQTSIPTSVFEMITPKTTLMNPGGAVSETGVQHPMKNSLQGNLLAGKGLKNRSSGLINSSSAELLASSQKVMLEQGSEKGDADEAVMEDEEQEGTGEAHPFLADQPKSDDPTPVPAAGGKQKGGVRFGGDGDEDKSLRERSSSFLDFAGRRRAGGTKVQNMASVFDFKEDESPEWRKRVNNAFNSWPLLVFFTVLTIWALFGDDFRLAVCPPSVDEVFVGITYFMLTAFVAELVTLCIVKPDYAFSFYFWLDFIATASLIFDIPAVNDAMLDSSNEDTAESTTLARAGRTSRVGTRAGRIARVVRVIRLVRMLKIYKAVAAYVANMRNWDKDDDLNESPDEQKDDDENGKTVESRVGLKLTELTTRRVIIGVLLMLFVLPVFQVDSGYYGAPEPFENEGLRMLHNMYLVGADSSSFEAALVTYTEEVGFAIAGRSTNGIVTLTVCNETQIEPLLADGARRDTELSTFVVSTGCYNTPVVEGEEIPPEAAQQECFRSYVITDNKWDSQFDAILNTCRTTFTCIVLGLGALLFSRDANALVLHPLERMVQKVKEMSENPLAKMQIRAVATKDEQQLETRILENSITKICSLLAVGFGDAGAEVVAENIRNGGDLNPMVPGHKMCAIFGFCDIRRFTDATEVLQEGVMEFVNSIAKIVHMEVSLHGGSANKNIGDAFLLVWKLPTQLASNPDNLELAAASLPDEKRESVAHLADRALAAFVVIHVALKRSPRLKQFCEREDIRARMGNDFQVSMGFGLHVGWAIEGAIGSEYKIDASYLSPNVNMASRLEAATKQFGCSLLMSDDFAMLLSPGVRKLCRAIDVIMVKGSNKPITLYTYDISLSAIADPSELEYQEDNMESLSHSFLSFKSEFEENPDITESIGSSQAFRDKFATGFQAYVDGRWEEAKNILVSCLNRVDPTGVSITDGPTASLLEVMGRYDFAAPRSWKGVRALTEK